MAGLSVGVQLVSRRESPPRALGMERQELLTKSEVLEDEILAERNALTADPRRCRSNTIMAKILPKSA
jgi:hypothetical protein